MQTLTEAEYQIKAQPMLRKIFVHDDPFVQPFSSTVQKKLIIAPFKYILESPLTSAVLKGALSVGDKGGFLTLLWRDKAATEPAHWYIPLTEFYDAYVEDKNHQAWISKENFSFSLRESAIYSPQGKWGIILTHESFGLMGGTIEFFNIVYSVVPDIEQQVFQFLENIKLCKEMHREVAVWVKPLLIHIYGATVTRELLIEAGLVRFKNKGMKFLI